MHVPMFCNYDQARALMQAGILQTTKYHYRSDKQLHSAAVYVTTYNNEVALLYSGPYTGATGPRCTAYTVVELGIMMMAVKELIHDTDENEADFQLSPEEELFRKYGYREDWSLKEKDLFMIQHMYHSIFVADCVIYSITKAKDKPRMIALMNKRLSELKPYAE